MTVSGRRYLIENCHIPLSRRKDGIRCDDLLELTMFFNDIRIDNEQ